jgi:hypothetical protein
VDHREDVTQLIAEIDDEVLTSLLVLNTPGVGPSTRTWMVMRTAVVARNGNVQCRGKDSDVFVAEVNLSDSISKICSFVKIGFPKVN